MYEQLHKQTSSDKATREISLLARAQEVFSAESVNLQRVRGC